MTIVQGAAPISAQRVIVPRPAIARTTESPCRALSITEISSESRGSAAKRGIGQPTAHHGVHQSQLARPPPQAPPRSRSSRHGSRG